MITGMPRIAIAVQDIQPIVSFFQHQLGMRVVDLSKDKTANKLGANLAMCIPEGGSNIELMAPDAPDAPLSKSLQKFIDGRGEGIFALMLEAADPDVEAAQLMQRGLQIMPLMAGASGRDIHPRHTHGVLVRIYPTDSFRAPKSKHNAFPNSELTGINKVLIAVRDLGHAVEVYGKQLMLETGEPINDPLRGISTVICRPPTGGQIELLAVQDASQPFAKKIQSFIDSRGEGMFALVIGSKNMPATIQRLAENDLKAAPAIDSTDIIEIDPSGAFGVLIRIESA
ncbi:MAG: VOC family protein [Pseudomonadales bacterium]|nr:VOC family protein [Pseudomonadales bacterium]